MGASYPSQDFEVISVVYYFSNLYYEIGKNQNQWDKDNCIKH